MRLKKLLVGLLALTMTASFAGCSSEDNKAETKADTKAADSKKGEIVIGVSLQNLSEEFMTMLKGSMEIQTKEYDNVKLVVNDAESKADKQTAQLDSFIAQKVDAVILSPVDADAMAPAVKAVADAGIPVITCSADVTGDMGQAWVGSENENGGEIEAQFIADKLNGKGKIAVLRGPLGAFAEQGRFAGYEKVFANYPDIKIEFDQTANWQREEAMSLVENWLTTGEEINAILCQNDAMALGALEAVKAAGKKDNIIIAGIDAIEDALNSIKDGELDATCFQDAISQGKGAVEMAVKAANGEKIERNNIPFELVTKDNVDGYYDRIKLPK